MIIAALASAPGKCGVSVIRISGENCISLLLNFFTPKNKKMIKKMEYSKLYFGQFHDSNEVIDEIMISFFKNGVSYTGEESAEITCHGSPLIIRKILQTLYTSNKVREAQPGEFTQKRFMNGKIDLVQAEAVIDLINSESDSAYESSKEQMSGSLSTELLKIKDMLVNLLSHLELELDFAEEDLDFMTKDEIDDKFMIALNVISKFITSFNSGKIYREGIKVALVGKVNAGKSSLMNCLLNTERVIVTEIEGTTRDIIEEKIEVNGIMLRIFDTAGFRITEDLVEKEGIKRSFKAIEDADLILHILDAETADENTINEYSHLKNKTIRVFNKIDKVKNKPALTEEDAVISCKTAQGISELKNQIVEKVLKDDITYQSSHITNLRHYNILRETYSNLELARESLVDGQNNEVIILDVRNALDRLGEITGETTGLDIINNIFGSFCIGK